MIKRLVILAFVVTGGVSACMIPPPPTFASLAPWSHVWDANDAITYADSTGAARVASIPDRGNAPHMDLVRDAGWYGSATNAPPIPGPLYQATNPVLNGRASFLTDKVTNGYAPNSMLSPNANPYDSTTWFNAPNGIAAPYWVAILSRSSGVDSTRGDIGTGPTIGPPIVGSSKLWSWSTFGPKPFPYAHINHQVSPSTETTLVLEYTAADPNQSFLEVTWRDAGGKLQTVRGYGTVTPYTYKELFFGWVDGHNYTSAMGLAIGTPTETQLTTIRNWAAASIPNAGS